MGRLAVPKYKTTYYTTGGVFSLDVEGDADIDGVLENAVGKMLKADYFTLKSPSSSESKEPQSRTLIVREHLVALQIDEELEL